MRYIRAAICFGLVTILCLCGCSRINFPNVEPPATPVIDSPAPLPTDTSSSRAPHASGISTREPLPTETSSEEASAQISGEISSAPSTPGPIEASGSLGSPSTATDSSWIADAKGSLPSIQPVRMRAVWVATVENIDFPKTVGDAEAQKRECQQILDNVKSWGMDTVIFQVRTMADALYKSDLNPWSHYLTGSQGTDPGWDPLQYMIDEAHARGLSLHVWLNPYRAIHSAASMEPEDLAESSFVRAHPEWVFEFDGTWYLDPAVPEVQDYIADTVREIIDNYDVDGVHFDDYFYPSNYPLPSGAERDGILDRERRENVNTMIRKVHDVIKEKNERIIFGVSPFGIWKNSSSDPEGSLTTGSESYYAQAADSLAWVREKIIDYIAPQLYWTIGNEAAGYSKLVDWWSDKLKDSGVSLLIGQGIYQDEVAGEITQQLELNAAHPEITGSIFYNYSSMVQNPACIQAVKDFYAN